VQAYADHRSLVLSPDMVWLIISQGFSRYVNAHAEEMRDLLVFHEGKMELVVNSNNNILLPTGSWERLLNDFSTCIARNTKGELADLMTANFTTTGITERIASQISLMDVVKHYFIYTNIAAACGIPSIELKGTPHDWQKVLDKAHCLRKYNLEKWSDDLVVILKEFVEASKGKVNKKFWQGIVKKKRVDQLESDMSCDPDPAKMTKLDGWFLKFFPNSQGETPDKVAWNHDMPQEMVRVNFQQVLTDPETDLPIDTIPIQLWAGFVGIEENATTRALTPKIGWLARIGDEESDEVGRFKELNKYSGSISIDLSRGEEVPIALSKLEHIRTLHLDFWSSPVVIPEWLDKIPIDELHIMGKFTDEEGALLRQRFPNVKIERVEDIFKSFKPLSSEKSQKAKETKAVKAGDKISGTVSDAAGPLWGATVCEIDVNGRIVESTITDSLGMFTINIKNPQDHLRFSYVGAKTIDQPINLSYFQLHQIPHYHIVLGNVSPQRDMRLRKRETSHSSNQPIPLSEIDQIIKERGMVKAEEWALTGDPVISNENNPRVQVSLTDEERALVMPVNDLGFNLFRQLSMLMFESVLLSPLSMTYALGLINNGAAGKTRTQINQVLGCDDKGADKVNSFCRKMLTEASKLDKMAQLEITNEFFSPKSFTPKPAFKEVAKDSYDTNFKESESDPFKFTLRNTIYFKGIWADKFRKVNTRDEVFRGENGKETTVPMMNQMHQFFYTENDLCQTLCLPYSNGAYQMIVLLPKEGRTVQEVAQSLTADSWQKIYDQMRRIDVDVKLPRFESSSEVNLTGVMSALMPHAFDMKKANFSYLFDIESCIDKIKQKGRIKVDETGAEAFAITSLQGDLGSLRTVQPETIRFHATHPFLYFIREFSTGAIFFIGQYMGS
jgi:serine protease inhibitor